MTLVSRERIPTENNSSKKRCKILTASVVVTLVVCIAYVVSFIGNNSTSTKPFSSVSLRNSVEKRQGCQHPLTHSLKGILLAINFNHPYYRSIDILLEYYKDIFPNYVICGPVRDPRKKHSIIVIKHPLQQRGFFGFQCLPEAIKRNPGYDGYLYINDDMLVNWWNLLDLDQSKIWFGCDIKYENSITIGRPPHNNWWQRADSAVQCTKAFNIVYSSMVTNWMREIYDKNTGGRKLCLSCWSDIYYIPGHLSMFFARFGDVFYKNDVFLEASVPTIISFLDYRTNYIRLDGKYLPDKYQESINYFDGSMNSPLWQEYNRKLVFVHPYKLMGNKQYQEINTNNFRRNMVERSKVIIKERCMDTILSEVIWNNFR